MRAVTKDELQVWLKGTMASRQKSDSLVKEQFKELPGLTFVLKRDNASRSTLMGVE